MRRIARVVASATLSMLTINVDHLTFSHPQGWTLADADNFNAFFATPADGDTELRDPKVETGNYFLMS